MVSVPVQCPHCHSTAFIKAGKQANGTQRCCQLVRGNAVKTELSDGAARLRL